MLDGTILDLENAVHDPAQGVATINIQVSPDKPSTVTVVSPAAGAGQLNFTAPMADGYADASMNLSARPWLQYDWDGTAPEDNPTGRATFGLFRGSPRHIYLRQRFN
jgi:MSHA biogenesis protein MshQ